MVIVLFEFNIFKLRTAHEKAILKDAEFEAKKKDLMGL